jgi:hypothetical protein
VCRVFLSSLTLCNTIGVNEERSIFRTLERRSWNCFLKHAIKGKVERSREVTGRREKRHKQLLDDLKKTIVYWKMKEETLDGTLWKTRLEETVDLSEDRLRNE